MDWRKKKTVGYHTAGVLFSSRLILLMWWGFIAVVTGAVCLSAQLPVGTQGVVERLAKEADLFDRMAHRVAGVETLRQTLPRGSRIAKGKRGVDTVLPEQVREIVSEYGFMGVDERGGSLKEVRMVVSVDGQRWKKRNKNLDSLARTLSATDDKKRRSLLESYENFGLQGFVTDLGQLILLFSRGLVSNYEIRYVGKDNQSLDVYEYTQLGGTDALTVYEGKAPLRLKLQGKIWVQASDKLPVGLSVESTREENKSIIRDISIVEYAPSDFGFLLPKRINHRQYVGEHLFVEDDFNYRDFKQVLPGVAAR
jgi:hypothetical protein